MASSFLANSEGSPARSATTMKKAGSSISPRASGRGSSPGPSEDYSTAGTLDRSVMNSLWIYSLEAFRRARLSSSCLCELSCSGDRTSTVCWTSCSNNENILFVI